MLEEEKEHWVPGAEKGQLVSQKVISQNSNNLSDHSARESRTNTMKGTYFGRNCLATAQHLPSI